MVVLKRLIVRLVTVFGVLAVMTPPAMALQSSSTTYGIDQASFGNGGVLSACSTTYCSQQSAGETAVGNSASTNYQTQAGTDVTDRNQYIEFVVNSTSLDLGKLSPTAATTATATFSVKTYLASGYVVLNASPGPTNGSYTMHTLSSPSSSVPGTEQFGINLAANTTACGAPANIGAAPVQLPDNTFAFGQVPSQYSQCGKFTYNNGDVIAKSTKSTSTTDYTISYLFNISPVTPGGTYTLNHVLVATSTF